MKACERTVQTFVRPELHCALKMRAAQMDQTIVEIVRDLIETYCAGSSTTDIDPRTAIPRRDARHVA